jgi:hypothetical protein
LVTPWKHGHWPCIFHYHIIWPLISFHHSLHPPTSRCFALALPCHWFQSILCHIHLINSFHPTFISINSFLSILSIHSYHIQSISTNHFNQIHLSSISINFSFLLIHSHLINSTLVIPHLIHIILPILSMFILLSTIKSKNQKKIYQLCNQY